MLLWSFVCLVAAVLALAQALMALYLGSRAALNRAVALMAVNYAVWMLFLGMALVTPGDQSPFWERAATVTNAVCILTPLLVILIMAGLSPRVIAAWMLVPSLLVLVQILLPEAHHVLNNVTRVGVWILELSLLVWTWQRTPSQRFRRILEQFALVGLASAVLAQIVLGVVHAQELPDVSPVAYLPIVINYFVLVVRFDHLVETQPELVSVLFRSLRLQTLLVDREGRIRFASDELAHHWGTTEHELRGQSALALLGPNDALEARWQTLATGGQRAIVATTLFGRPYRLNLVPHTNRHGDLEHVLILFEPVRDLAATMAHFGLSPREREVAELLLEAMTVPEIGAALSISPTTVKNHLQKIFAKTGARNRVDLVRCLTRPDDLAEK